MRLLIILGVIFLLVACAPVNNDISIEPVEPLVIIAPDIPQVPNEVMEENNSNVSPDLINELRDTCLRRVEFEIEDACFKSDDLQLELKNTGTLDIDHFQVWVIDRFDEKFKQIIDVNGLQVEKSGKKVIPKEAYDEKPYGVRIRPIINVGGVEYTCTAATELYTVAGELTKC